MQANYWVTYKKTTKILGILLMNPFGLKEAKKTIWTIEVSVNSILQITYFQLSVKEDHIDSANAGGLNALDFDEDNWEKRPWKFFNFWLTPFKVVYFTTGLFFQNLIVKNEPFGSHCFRAQLATLFQTQSYEQIYIY